MFAHFLVGAAKSLVTLRTWWAAGFEMTLAGIIVGGVTFLVGLALPLRQLGNGAPRARSSRRSSASTRASAPARPVRPAASGPGTVSAPAALAFARRRARRRRRGGAPGRLSRPPCAVRAPLRRPSSCTKRSSFCPGRRSSAPHSLARSTLRRPARAPRGRATHDAFAAALSSPGVCGPRSSSAASTASCSRLSPSPSSARWRYLVARLNVPLASRASP